MVCNFIVADVSGLVQVTLWGDLAQKLHQLAVDWLENCQDGSFPVVQLEAAQVGSYGGRPVPCLARLQSTNRTQVTYMGAAPAPRVQAAPSSLCRDTTLLRPPGVTTCIGSAVVNLKEPTFSQEDACMRGFDLVPEDGWRVPVMLHGAVAEDDEEDSWKPIGNLDQKRVKNNCFNLTVPLFQNPLMIVPWTTHSDKLLGSKGIPMEISKNFGGNLSSSILSARNRQTSHFHCISWGISKRSFSLALESVDIHFLEG